MVTGSAVFKSGERDHTMLKHKLAFNLKKETYRKFKFGRTIF